MLLRLPINQIADYSSASQKARVAAEAWAQANLYCANCSSPQLSSAKNNTPVFDYECPKCTTRYQLKSRRVWSEHRLVDAAYEPMIAAVRARRVPDLFVLQYDNKWTVRRLVLIPGSFFTPQAIERRTPLADNARRAGWVGCTILLSNIPEEGKLRIVDHPCALSCNAVRRWYGRVRPFSEMRVDSRGWTLAVLRIVEQMPSTNFTLADIYQYEPQLSRQFPNNRHVRPKIRQQLQVLRDMGYLRFLNGGRYAMLKPE